MDLPSGAVTFLFTDIEGSTRLLQALGDGFVESLRLHSDIIETAVGEHDGLVVNTEGDAYFCVFTDAVKAAACSVAIVTRLEEASWPRGEAFRVRIGFHTGEGVPGSHDYVGIDVHRAARISAVGHGGQILLSAESHELVEDHLPDGVKTIDLGPHSLKDLPDRELLYQLVIPGVRSRFPRLRIGADPRLPLPPMMRPDTVETSAATPPASAPAPAPAGFIGALPRSWLAGLALVAGLVVGTGIGAILFGSSECEVCVDADSANAAPMPQGAPGESDTVTSDANPQSSVTEAQRITLAPLTTEDSPPPDEESLPSDPGVAGAWTFTVSVTGVDGSVCQGEIGEVYQRQVTIAGPEEGLEVTGLDDPKDPDDPPWSGTFADGLLTFTGTRAEDDGITTAVFEMTLSPDGRTLTGTESWTWDWTSRGETGTCTNGESSVTATRSP